MIVNLFTSVKQQLIPLLTSTVQLLGEDTWPIQIIKESQWNSGCTDLWQLCTPLRKLRVSQLNIDSNSSCLRPANRLRVHDSPREWWAWEKERRRDKLSRDSASGHSSISVSTLSLLRVVTQCSIPQRIKMSNTKLDLCSDESYYGQYHEWNSTSMASFLSASDSMLIESLRIPGYGYWS